MTSPRRSDAPDIAGEQRRVGLDSDRPATSLVETPPGRMHCGSCGRFVGPYEGCPYCGAEMAGRLSVRIVKIAAIVLATVGLALVWWSARGVPIPEITLGEAGGTMNLAYVRVRGRLSRGLTYDPESAYLGFWLSDETGEIHVNCYEGVTQALMAEGRMPAVGDEITIAGTLRIREDFVSLTLDVPGHLEIDRPDPVPLEVGRVTILDEGLRVRVRGEIWQVREPYEGLTLIDLRDENGEITVAVDESVEAMTGALPALSAGQEITAVGAVGLYRTTPQIVPADVADLQVSPLISQAATEVDQIEAAGTPEPVPLVVLSKITEDDLGRTVRTAGRVTMLEGLAGGVKISLDDGTAQRVLLLWEDVYEAFADPSALDVGAQVAVTGTVQVYRGTVEVIPRSAGEVVIVEPASPPRWVQIGDLTDVDVGSVVRARGVLREPQGFSAGVKVRLSDGTGEITLLLWSQFYEALSPRPQKGQQVEVVGLVDVYRDELELVPRTRHDWHVRLMED